MKITERTSAPPPKPPEQDRPKVLPPKPAERVQTLEPPKPENVGRNLDTQA